MSHLDAEQLQDLALGGGSGHERAFAHVERCERCRRALDELSGVWSSVAQTLPACPPPSSLRAELLAEIAGPARYAPFTARVAELFALEEARAATLLARAADPASFRAAKLAGATGVAFASAEVGAPLGDARACFLRAAPGTRYPRHAHDGEERVLVLEGGFRDDAGREAHAGDLERNGPGSAHAFVVLDDAPCVSAIVSTGPIRLVG